MKNIFSYLILAAAVISLSSCTTSLTGFKQTSYPATVRSGQKTKMVQNFHIDSNCRHAGYPDIDIVEQPKHGRLEIVHQPLVADTQGKWPKCDKLKVKGTVAYYTSERGFVGSDRFVLKTPYERGNIVQGTFNLNVVK